MVPSGAFAATASSPWENGAISTGLIVFTIMLLTGILLHKRLSKELAHASTALRKSKHHLKLMGDKLPNVTFFQLSFSAGGKLKFRYLSSGVEETLNIDRGLLLKDAGHAIEYIYEDDIGVLKKAALKVGDDFAPVELEIRMLDQTGNQRWLEISAVAHLEKKTIVWDGLVKDISASKNIERVLSEEKHNFEHLFESIDDFLFVCDMNGKLLHTNTAVERQLQFSADELANMSLFDLYAEPVRTDVFEVMARMQKEARGSCNLPMQHKGGGSVAVEMSLCQGLWKDQHSIFCVARNIARRKQNENALRESQHMLQLIMDTIPMTVFWADKNSAYLGCNKSFIQECDLQEPHEVIGKRPTDLFNPERAKELIESNQQVINSNRPFNKMHSYARSDSTVGWRETSKIPLHGEDGSAVGVLGVWRDVTEQRQAENRLKYTLEDLERFNQLMRGRERRTLQLKAEINNLLKELGRPTKYQTTTDSPL